MEAIRIVDERAPYLLIAHGHRFAVIERRNGNFYNLHSGDRAPAPMTDAGALAVVGTDWRDEETARRVFDEIVTRYSDLAEHMW